MKWVKWKDHQGVRHIGSKRYDPPQPWGPWTKIMGIIARCEGNHDTVVSYDGTGVTWGFMQWTFTSGRLQRLLEFMKSIEAHDFDKGVSKGESLFDKIFIPDGKDTQIFEEFGFSIVDGCFVDTSTGKVLNPSNKSAKKRIDDICMGRARHNKFAYQREHAQELAQVFIDAGQDEEVAFAQIEFAKNEFKRSLRAKRGPLGHIETIDSLLDFTWNTHLPGVFFNLWQNNPKAAYRLFMNAYTVANLSHPKGHPIYLDIYTREVWRRLNSTKFGNWSFAKPENKSPRIQRIKKALKEFYDLDLKVVR